MSQCKSLLRLYGVMQRTGLSKSMIYKLMRDDKFPKQIYITKHCVGWVEDEVHDWVLNRLEESRISA